MRLLEVGDKLLRYSTGDIKRVTLLVERVTKKKAVCIDGYGSKVELKRESYWDGSEWIEWGYKHSAWGNPTKYRIWTQERVDAIELYNKRSDMTFYIHGKTEFYSSIKNWSTEKLEAVYEVLKKFE